MAGRIKLLFLGSTPSGSSRTRVGAEAREIKSALASAGNSAPGSFDFDDNHAIRIDRLQRIVVDARAQIVHFAGHGSKAGELIFEDEDGNAMPANPAAIAKLFQLVGRSTRLVVLNACYMHDQALAIAEHVDVVIGMSAAIPDKTAIEFASELYAHLARGSNVGEAFELAKNNASMQYLPGSHMPQIVHRGDVDPGTVFLTRSEATAHVATGSLRPLDPTEILVRSNYLQQVRTHVENLLRESIHRARFIDLGIVDSPKATLPWVYKNTTTKQEFASVEEAFRTYHRQLLLLGAPGSGKTVTLLHIALALLNEAERDPGAAIPLIVNLSKFQFEARLPSWLGRLGRSALASPDRSFESWLISELRDRGLRAGVAQRWVEEGRIAALLDGLDEVNDERRADLALLLNETYLKDHQDTIVVICSRTDEYLPLQGRRSTRLRLLGAVTLQLLERAQIDAYLDVAGASGVREALGRDGSLSELAQTPLMLSMMTLTYGGKSAAKIPSLSSLADQRHHLMESFVARMLQRKERRDRKIEFDDDDDKEVPTSEYRYRPDRVDRYLSWLAVRLSLRMQTACSLRRLLGFLELPTVVDESPLVTWITWLPRIILVGAMMTVVALGLAPDSRTGRLASAAMVFGICGLYACIFLFKRVWEKRISSEDVMPDVFRAMIGVLWISPFYVGLALLFPSATAMGIGFISLTTAIAVGTALFAWLNVKPAPWPIVVGTILGVVIGIALIHQSEVAWSTDKVIGASMVGGQAIGILIASYRTDRPVGSVAIAVVSIILVLAVSAGLFSWGSSRPPNGGTLSWDFVLVSVGVSVVLILGFLKNPTASTCSLVAVVASGALLGGLELIALSGGIWGIAFSLLAIAASKPNPVKQLLDEINGRFERTFDAWLLTPAAKALLTVLGILPQRPRAFARYCRHALILKPLSGEIEFVHRRLRDYFALRELVPQLKGFDPRRRTNAIAMLGLQGVAAIDLLTELLVEGSADERAAAVRALGRISAPEIAGHLRRALADRAPEVRGAVAMSLRNVDVKESSAMLRIAVNDPHVDVVKSVIDAIEPQDMLMRLASFGYWRLRPVLITRILARSDQVGDLVRHVARNASSQLALELGAALPGSMRPIVRELLFVPQRSVRKLICEWMAKNLMITDVAALIEVMKSDPDVDVRRAAVAALGVSADERAVQPLVQASTDHSPQVRASAVAVLGHLGAMRALEALVRASEDRNRNVRKGALAALGALKDAGATDVLLHVLLHERAHMRSLAATALAACGGRRAVEPLIAALADGDADVRSAAAYSLGALQDTRAVEPLIKALSNRNGNVRRAAARSLGMLQDQRALEPLIKALSDRNGNVRQTVAESLGTLQHTRAVEPLIRALADRDKYVRWAATKSLEVLHDARTVEPLIYALTGKKQTARLHAARILGVLQDARAVEPLIQALIDERSFVRSAAASSLGTLGDTRAVEPLIRTLADSNDDVREEAIASLGTLGDQRAVEPLLPALVDKSDLLRSAAATSLGVLGDPRAVEPLIRALADQKDNVAIKVAESLGKLQCRLSAAMDPAFSKPFPPVPAVA